MLVFVTINVNKTVVRITVPELVFMTMFGNFDKVLSTLMCFKLRGRVCDSFSSAGKAFAHAAPLFHSDCVVLFILISFCNV